MLFGLGSTPTKGQKAIFWSKIHFFVNVARFARQQFLSFPTLFFNLFPTCWDVRMADKRSTYPLQKKEKEVMKGQVLCVVIWSFE